MLLRSAVRWASSVPVTSPAVPGDDVITPWMVTARGPKGIDYQRVITQFRSEPVDDAVVRRFSQFLKTHRPQMDDKPHHFLRRRIAFSHRDLNAVLDDVENGRSIYLYTGRGPSAQTMHVGHVLPFLLTKYLQDAFHCPLVIQITDDEKFLFRDLSLGPSMDEMVNQNILDIIAFGFDPAKTFIFRNTKFMGDLYPTVLEVQRCITTNAAKHTFGFTDTDNIGKIAFAATQAAPAFASSFRRTVLPIKSHKLRCLIPCAIDQDPFFLLTRSVSERLKRPKPALLHTKFLPALKGAAHKMSSSAVDNGVVLLTDSDDVVHRKMRRAFSGGSGTLEELQRSGANVDEDVAFQFLQVFAKDDALVDQVRADYSSGKIHSGTVKTLAADALIRDVLVEWRERRKHLTAADVEKFCEPRNILWQPRVSSDT